MGDLKITMKRGPKDKDDERVVLVRSGLRRHSESVPIPASEAPMFDTLSVCRDLTEKPLRETSDKLKEALIKSERQLFGVR